MREEYRVKPEAEAFEWYVEKHLESGFVFSRPDVFLACRPVVSTAEQWQIKACDYLFHWGECDAWYVSMLAGNLANVWDFMPWFLPLICLQRSHGAAGRKLRFYSTDRLKQFTMSPFLFNLNAVATA